MCQEANAERLSRPEPTGRTISVSDGEGGQKTNDQSGTRGLELEKGLPLSQLVL